MIRIYGASDDLVEIEGSDYKENEIGCFEANVRIWFDDGTVIKVGYPKQCGAIWWIVNEEVGSASQWLHACYDEDADIYSDIFEIDSEIVRHEVIENAAV